MTRFHCCPTVAGSSALGAKAGSGDAGLNKVKELFRRGSAERLSDGRVSRYGKQTGDTHGGLLHSRTPFTFFNEPRSASAIITYRCWPPVQPMATVK